MSHITRIVSQVKIKDLALLEKAARRCGLELVRGKTRIKGYYGERQEDRCLHVLRIPAGQRAGAGSYADWEIGIVEGDEPGTFALAFDRWGGEHNALVRRVGDNGERLQAFYQAETIKKAAAGLGDTVTEKIMPDGSIQLEIDTTLRLGV